MESRGEKCKEHGVMLESDRCDAVVANEPGEERAEAQDLTPRTIEISDDDYRTLHMPCDTLEENDVSEPGD